VALEENVLLHIENDSNPEQGQERASNNSLRKKILAFIQKYAPWYYIFLFFYGNTLIFNSTSDCATNAPILNKLAVTYIIFQYIGFSLPVLVCSSILCICCSALCCAGVRVYQGYRQALVSQEIITQLPVKKYPTELASDPECTICMCAYENGSEIIELDCSKMHHFHAECIKKWLSVNGICPICRMSLQEMKKKKAEREKEAKRRNPRGKKQ